MSVLRELKRRVAASKTAFIEPCLPTLAVKPPSGPKWIHEIKHDGFRLQARKDDLGIALLTRNGNIWTQRYPSIVEAVKALPCRSCIIDGEVVVTDERGLAVFDKLRYGPREKPEAMLFAFDLLAINRDDLRRAAIEERKAELVRCLEENALHGIRYVEHFSGEDDVGIIFEHACALRCEGIVSKRLGSKYVSGRSQDWIKVKNSAAPGARRLEEED